MKSISKKSIPGTIQHKLYVRIIERFGSAQRFAEHLGISAGYLSNILSGRADIPDRIAAAVGFKLVVSLEDAEAGQ